MKNIRNNYIKESLLDYQTLTESLKANTTNAVKDLLAEAVKETYNNILKESEDDFDEEEVEDTVSDNASTESDELGVSETEDGAEGEEESTIGAAEETETEVTPDGAVEKTTVGSDSEGKEWGNFEQYKVNDDEYDLSNAQDDEIVKAYKLMKDEDELVVTKDGDKIHLQDNGAGVDYIIDLGSVPEKEEETEDDDETVYEIESDNDEDNDFEENNNMNEQKIFEIALNEYDSNVGYTDNYQKKDVMTNPGMSEPAKTGRDWDKGIPHGTEKPWSGKKDKYDAPFTAEKGKTVEEGEEVMDVTPVEEATNVGGFVQQNSTSKSHVPNSNGRKARSMSKDGERKKGTTEPRYSSVEESVMKQVNAIKEENEALKESLKSFKQMLSEAATTNVSLGKIIKLISENSVTMDEKKEIISRFGKEVNSIEQANTLYESISQELKKKSVMNINEDKQFTVGSSKMINETQIYKSKDLMDSLGMMHKICKL